VLLISFIALPIRGLVAAQPYYLMGRLPGADARRRGRRAAKRRRPRPWLGASLSPALGGWIAQYLGYPTMFMILGSFDLKLATRFFRRARVRA
jgi:hypothetical protein